MVLFFIGKMLIKDKKRNFQLNNIPKAIKCFLLLFSIYFIIHVVLRTFLWLAEFSDIYGNTLYNVWVHSFFYSLAMTLISVGVTCLLTKGDKDNLD